MHQAEKKGAANRKVKNELKSEIDAFKKSPTPKAYAELVSSIDKAAKTNIIHKNKADRLKSRLSKLLKSEKTKKKA